MSPTIGAAHHCIARLSPRQVRVHSRWQLEGLRHLHSEFQSGDHITDTWEEGSHLKVNIYKTTGGTGKFQAQLVAARTRWTVSRTLSVAADKGQIVLPEMRMSGDSGGGVREKSS